MDEIFEQLAEPFHPEQVHWRVGPRTQDKSRGIPLAYIDARDVMERLDQVVGPGRWEDKYQETPSGRIICRLSLYFQDGTSTTKSDGAGDTGTEGEKGAISDAFKRAAVKFGVGRYLYSINAGWVDLDNGDLPRGFDGSRFLPDDPYIDYMALVREHWDSIAEAKRLLLPHYGKNENQINVTGAREVLKELGEETYMALWKAPTKGGVFTTNERHLLKEKPEDAL